jgi:5-methylcytosine-specific restriction enzyme A
MSTYLLTWNPDRFEWSDFNRDAVAVARGIALESKWSCGTSKAIPIGARFFLYRQGNRGRGVVGSGWIARATFQDRHWEPERAAQGDTANFVGIALDALLNPDAIAPMAVEHIHERPLADVYWHTPASGIEIGVAAGAELNARWLAYADGTAASKAVEDDAVRALEGEERLVMVLHRSRERALREAKLATARREAPDGRLRCEVPGCGFDFHERYGAIGEGYAQVHHLQPLADLDGPKEMTLADLAVVCANCHAMIHRGGRCSPLIELIAPAG